ncbi:MAG: transglycosylase SLT domain-containing protein [Moraxellaceae bacterium]|nr:transglycosylase SLT domain-containing protein [Moraxellaceae bacterium]
MLLSAIAMQPVAPALAQLSEAGRQVLARSLLEQAVAAEHGEGAPRDPERAAGLYCEAARMGDAEAQYSLGWMYANGRGVARSATYAASLFATAAAQGHAGALKAQAMVGDSSGEMPPCFSAKPAAVPAKAPAADAETAFDRDEITRAQAEDLNAYLATLPPDRRRIAELISLLAPKYGIEPRLALAIAAAESNFNIMARSPKGALGVMQLIPDTAARFGVKKPFEPGQNIRGGLSYLRWLLAYYQGDVLLAVAAYNAGEGAVDRYRGIPPYMETVFYVKRIYGFYRQPRHAFDANVTGPSAIVVKAAVAGR